MLSLLYVLSVYLAAGLLFAMFFLAGTILLWVVKWGIVVGLIVWGAKKICGFFK